MHAYVGCPQVTAMFDNTIFLPFEICWMFGHRFQTGKIPKWQPFFDGRETIEGAGEVSGVPTYVEGMRSTLNDPIKAENIYY